MGAFGPHVIEGDHHARAQLALDAKVPLIDAAIY